MLTTHKIIKGAADDYGQPQKKSESNFKSTTQTFKQNKEIQLMMNSFETSIFKLMTDR